MVSYMSAAAHCGQPYHPAAATSNHGTIFFDLVSHIAFWQSLACAGSPYYPWHQTPIQASLWLRVLSTLYFCGLMVLGMLSVWRSWQNPVKAPVKHVCSNAHPYTAPIMLITLTTAGEVCPATGSSLSLVSQTRNDVDPNAAPSQPTPSHSHASGPSLITTLKPGSRFSARKITHACAAAAAWHHGECCQCTLPE
jgi:hypothetical protein